MIDFFFLLHIKITRDVVAIIGNLMNSDPEELAAAQGMNQSSSRAMQALEQQLQIVDLTKNNGSFTSVQPNLAVQVMLAYYFSLV